MTGILKRIIEYIKEKIGWPSSKPIILYLFGLGFARIALYMLHLSPAMTLPLFGILFGAWHWEWGTRMVVWLIARLPGLNIPLAILYGWITSGIYVCSLLLLWLRLRRAAIIVTLILAILWISDLCQYLQVPADPFFVFAESLKAFGVKPENIPAVSHAIALTLTIILAVGIPVLLALWFLRILDGTMARLSSLLWLWIWFLLVVFLSEYRIGVVLLLSLFAGGTVFLGGLYVTGSFLLPLPGAGHRRKVFDFLRDYALSVNFPAYVVVDELDEEDKIEERIPGTPFSPMALGPGIVLTDGNHAVAIYDGIRFKGVQRPGVIFTGFADQIEHTVDLRPQLRAFYARALTKDGIRIKVLAFTPFKIDSRGRQPCLGAPLPYNKSAAHKTFVSKSMEHEGKGMVPERMKHHAWDELAPMVAKRILQDIISQYNFDDLYGPYQPGGQPPRRVIARTFCERLAAELEPLGLQLVGGGISDLEPEDPQVYLKRVKSWQTDWERRVTLRQAEGQAEWLRTVERARAEAQTELILSLGGRLKELSTTRTEFRSENVLRQFLFILDEITGQPALRHALPEETLKGLMHIREVFTS